MEKLIVFLGASLVMVGLVILDGAVLMWLMAWWHSIRPAVPALGLGESVLVSTIVSVLTFKPSSK